MHTCRFTVFEMRQDVLNVALHSMYVVMQELTREFKVVPAGTNNTNASVRNCALHPGLLCNLSLNQMFQPVYHKFLFDVCGCLAAAKQQRHSKCMCGNYCRSVNPRTPNKSNANLPKVCTQH